MAKINTTNCSGIGIGSFALTLGIALTHFNEISTIKENTPMSVVAIFGTV
tara:strand:+ start:285 stop:434 length:150 start_codon:yes stop_codon:yes gene_type:complete